MLKSQNGTGVSSPAVLRLFVLTGIEPSRPPFFSKRRFRQFCFAPPSNFSSTFTLTAKQSARPLRFILSYESRLVW